MSSQTSYILVTGGAGYIGSHTVLTLLTQNYHVIVIDNLSNSSVESLQRVEKITGKTILFYHIDILDEDKVDTLFQRYHIDAVIHFAGLKSVNESISDPLAYYTVNVNGTINLLKCMMKHNCNKFIFSSSATVYGCPTTVPIPEVHRLLPINPYGQTKLMVEQILRDLVVSNDQLRVVILRYFNPIGAHESGEIGEDPTGIPNNLIPYITQTLAGKHSHINIYGDDYDTPDGTCIRDYIHVMDLADGHVHALKFLETSTHLHIFNLGTGRGYSVMEIIKVFQDIIQTHVPFQIAKRRLGDTPIVIADASSAHQHLHWDAKRDLHQMCADALHWQSKNPNGYKGKIESIQDNILLL
jgi:UDP-glucose 4-epimerase